jgi:hypothetical protein
MVGLVRWNCNAKVRTLRWSLKFQEPSEDSKRTMQIAPRVHVSAGASPSVRCTWGPHQQLARPERRPLIYHRRLKMQYVGLWAPTSKSPAFGAWRERHSVRPVKTGCIAPTTIVQSTLS